MSTTRAQIDTDKPLSFPPGPQPPDPPGLIYYDVPRSNPKMTIKFRDWELNPERSESDTYDVFRAAFRDASDPTLRDKDMPEETYLWSSGGVELEVNPVKEDEQHIFILTWGLWHTALRGVDNFRRFYPRLDVVFEIYIYPPGYEEDDNYLGIGYLDRR